MKRLAFPHPYVHAHPPVQDVNEILAKQDKIGDRAADWVAAAIGSWTFIIIQVTLLMIWVTLNVTAWVNHWDPYPFILMNLFLSMQAALTAPVIMMSQNRQASRDRLETHNDYLVNRKTEEEIKVVLEHLNAQDEALLEIHQMLAMLQTDRNGS